jgi:hypothetical protein
VTGSPAHPQPGVRFARWVFLLAGIVGVLEVLPLYFYESTLNRTQPPPITHPDFYYGFVGVVLAIYLLYAQGRVAASMLGGASLDLVWLVLFVTVWIRTREQT